MQVKINYFEIEKEDMIVLREEYNKGIKGTHQTWWQRLLKKEKNVFSSKNVTGNGTLLRFALKYLDRYFYRTTNIHEKNHYIELERYSCTRYDETPLKPFILHKDDGAMIEHNVNTIIFYLEKSIQGGDLLIEINKKRNFIPIFGGMGIVFIGSLLHTPTVCSGDGVRECIVVRVERLDSNVTNGN